MPGLGLLEKKPSRSGFSVRDNSPDSVIFTHESNFSLFSSASGSADRCSFASDFHDHEALVYDISKHLSERDLHKCSSGPDLDPISSTLPTVRKNSPLAKKGGKAKDREEEGIGTEGDDQTQNPAKEIFSQALKECQNRRLRSDATTAVKKSGRQRPTAIDLNSRGNDAIGSSPRLESMKKTSVSSHRSGTYPSPETPNCRDGSVGIQKGWSSERVPLPVNGTRRHVSSALLPFNNGRTLPSKWEDAEKWILSPVSGDGVSRPSLALPQRRPKSKSGPLGPPGIAYSSAYSPSMPMFEGQNVDNFMAASPFSARVLVRDGFTRGGGGNGSGGEGSLSVPPEHCILRSASVHGWSDLFNQSSFPGSQDEKLNGTKNAGSMISRAVSRRDVATQMSPEGSTHSSPKGRPSFSPSPSSLLPILELQSRRSSKLEVRDVQVDERVTVTRWSKKRGTRMPEKVPAVDEVWKKKAVEARPSAWEVAETEKCISKSKREEAKITAWENLQKAKAEAAIQKLEMKLEKKRSSSMDKIMNKLRSAQRKAQEMRNSMSASQAHQVTRNSSKGVSFCKTGQMGSLRGCFSCNAFRRLIYSADPSSSALTLDKGRIAS